MWDSSPLVWSRWRGGNAVVPRGLLARTGSHYVYESFSWLYLLVQALANLAALSPTSPRLVTWPHPFRQGALMLHSKRSLRSSGTVLRRCRTTVAPIYNADKRAGEWPSSRRILEGQRPTQPWAP